MGLNKTALADEVADRTDLSRRQVVDVLDSLVDVVQEQVQAGQEIKVPDLVNIKLGYKKGQPKGREVRNPQTGETSKADTAIPASIQVRASVNRKIKNVAPKPTSKAGKPIVDKWKERDEARQAREAAAAAEAPE